MLAATKATIIKKERNKNSGKFPQPLENVLPTPLIRNQTEESIVKEHQRRKNSAKLKIIYWTKMSRGKTKSGR